MQMYPDDKAHDNNYPFDLHIFFNIRMYYYICTPCEYLNRSLTQTKKKDKSKKRDPTDEPTDH